MASFPSIIINIATNQDRERIYQIRHNVYATELKQHSENENGRLSDALDAKNIYFSAKINQELIGFICITPPNNGTYSIDKYIKREDLPFEVTETLYEIRILTVLKTHRKTPAALLLMWASLRWIDAAKGTHVMAIGIIDILDLYLKLGFKSTHIKVESGSVNFELIYRATKELYEYMIENKSPLLKKLETYCTWNLAIPFYKSNDCYHGGAFFDAIGNTFKNLEKRHEIINADVLDAWYPPSPKILEALIEHLPWIARTSPPTDCIGMAEVIAKNREVKKENILPGAGSSDLIYLAFREWLNNKSKVLILDPMYGEYVHVLENMIQCEVDRISLTSISNYKVDLDTLRAASSKNYDLIVIVNPNSPTGQHIPKENLRNTLLSFPQSTRIWIDETYSEYAGQTETLENFATSTSNVIICKSMSKVYALSGLRSAYLCASPYQLEILRSITPPWSVSLPAQIAAVIAIQEKEYYKQCYNDTHRLREELVRDLKKLNIMKIVNTTTNFVLCHLDTKAMNAAEVVKRCRTKGLYLRDVGNMGKQFGQHTIRIAVKDAETNKQMISILNEVLSA